MPEEYKITHYVPKRVIDAMKRFNKLDMENTILALLDEAEEARALLEEVNEGFAPVMQRCCFCDASYDYPSADESTMEHADTCPIVKIRAFLSK